MAVDTLTLNLDNLYMTTYERVWPETVNNIFQKTPLWAWWSSKGRVKFVRGGRVLEFSVEYGENPTVAQMGKGDKFSMDESDFLAPARYDWTYMGGLLLNYFTDRQKNRGKSQRLDWIQSKISNLRMTLAKQLEINLCGAAADTDSSYPNGLQHLIDITPTVAQTNSVGGIDQSAKSWWQNQQYALQGAADLNLKNDMRHLHNMCSYFGSTPDVGICDVDSLEIYEDIVEEQKLIVNQKVGDAVFQSVLFRGMPLFWSPQAEANVMRFINSEHIFPVIDPDFMLKMLPWQTLPASADDRVAPVVLAMQVCATNRATSGALTQVDQA